MHPCALPDSCLLPEPMKVGEQLARHTDRKKGHWLNLGSRRDSFPIDHAHQRGVTMATP